MITLSNISKSYKSVVLDNISLNCHKGEVFCIAGANGSGKSTLLSIMTGLIKPDSGSVVCPGRIGYVPQDNGLFENISVKDNIDFWAKARNQKSDYSFFSERDLKKKVAHLSAGIKKKLSIHIAVSSGYDFLILDEPSTSLDLVYQKFIIDLINESKEKNKGVVFTSHNVTEIQQSDTLCILDAGNIAYNGNTRDFCDAENFQEKLYGIILKNAAAQ